MLLVALAAASVGMTYLLTPLFIISLLKQCRGRHTCLMTLLDSGPGLTWYGPGISYAEGRPLCYATIKDSDITQLLACATCSGGADSPWCFRRRRVYRRRSHHRCRGRWRCCRRCRCRWRCRRCSRRCSRSGCACGWQHLSLRASTSAMRGAPQHNSEGLSSHSHGWRCAAPMHM